MMPCKQLLKFSPHLLYFSIYKHYNWCNINEICFHLETALFSTEIIPLTPLTNAYYINCNKLAYYLHGNLTHVAHGYSTVTIQRATSSWTKCSRRWRGPWSTNWSAFWMRRYKKWRVMMRVRSSRPFCLLRWVSIICHLVLLSYYLTVFLTLSLSIYLSVSFFLYLFRSLSRSLSVWYSCGFEW